MKPITPKQLQTKIIPYELPPEVIEIINDQITLDWNGTYSKISTNALYFIIKTKTDLNIKASGNFEKALIKLYKSVGWDIKIKTTSWYMNYQDIYYIFTPDTSFISSTIKIIGDD